jgi:hypothetical protein
MQNGETTVLQVIPPGSKFKTKMEITKKGNRLWLKFGYNKKLLEEIKTCFTAPRWHGFENPPIKQWSVLDCFHNWFQLEFLMGENPYRNWQQEPNLDLTFERPVKSHQIEMVKCILTYKWWEAAYQMGTGKTLAMIEAMERSGLTNFLWVGPKSALNAVDLEFRKWDAKIIPHFVSYSMLKKLVETWPAGQPVYQGVVFDEAHNLKTGTSQRSIAAAHLADAIRKEHGFNGYIVLMTGSPAPKSPVDWYNQAETACPGYLKEGSIHKFKERLGIVANAENQVTGGVYQQLVTWRDNEDKCNVCGHLKDDPRHGIINSIESGYHTFVPSKNEVAFLYKRMKGLVGVKFKKDCLDLPDKQYQVIRCDPNAETIRMAKMIVATATSTAKCLTLLRELSDGFQYKETVSGKDKCPTCFGNKFYMQWVYTGPETDEQVDTPLDYEKDPNWTKQEGPCPQCGATGEIDTVSRETVFIDTPKEQVLRDLIDQHDEVGRIVIYGGFTGSVDRCVNIVQSIQGWEYIRVDGRGYSSSIGGNPTGLLQAFQEYKDKFPRIAFIGQPGAAGTGLTLTASPSIVYFSNDFNAVSRIQSEDRIHRLGMDTNRGAMIYDIFHLPSDEYVFNNLQKKRELQAISLGELKEALL